MTDPRFDPDLIRATAPAWRRGAWLRYVAASIAIVGVAHLIDAQAFAALYTPGVEASDWYHVLRSFGDMRLWAVVGAAWVAADSRRAAPLTSFTAWRRGLAIVLSAVAAGLGAEGAKLLIGRERPAVLVDGAREFQGYVFKTWGDGALGGLTDGSNLGLPSSHTAVAFAGAAAVGRMIPGTGAPLLLAAGGCGLSRLLHGAHFTTDVLAGAALGYAVGRALTVHHGKREAAGAPRPASPSV